MKARIVDAAGTDVPPGTPGEIIVRAPGMPLRYHKDPELTASTLGDGWFRTGDLGYRDEAGNFFLTGRLKDIIIRGGANIAPAELEEILLRHPAIQAAAVIGIPDSKYGEVPVAYLVSKGSEPVQPGPMREFCAAHLADFKIPSEFHFVAALPLGPTGKVDKGALRRLWSRDHQ